MKRFSHFLYFSRFIEEYAKAEVKIWALTTTNEPLNGIIPVVNFNSLGWTPAQLVPMIKYEVLCQSYILMEV